MIACNGNLAGVDFSSVSFGELIFFATLRRCGRAVATPPLDAGLETATHAAAGGNGPLDGRLDFVVNSAREGEAEAGRGGGGRGVGLECVWRRTGVSRLRDGVGTGDAAQSRVHLKRIC